MTTTTTPSEQMKQQLADIAAGRPPRPTTRPITTLVPPKGK